jgi:hypothetical protein
MADSEELSIWIQIGGLSPMARLQPWQDGTKVEGQILRFLATPRAGIQRQGAPWLARGLGSEAPGSEAQWLAAQWLEVLPSRAP